MVGQVICEALQWARLGESLLEKCSFPGCDPGRLQPCIRRYRSINPFILNKQLGASCGHEPCNTLFLQRLHYLTLFWALEIQVDYWGLARPLRLSVLHCTQLQWMDCVKGKHWEISCSSVVHALQPISSLNLFFQFEPIPPCSDIQALVNSFALSFL